MEVLPAAADMEEVIMAEGHTNQEHMVVAATVINQVDIHIIQDIMDSDIQDTEAMAVTVDTEDTDQDGHITGDQDVDGSVANIGIGITVDGCPTGHFHTHFPVTDFINRKPPNFLILK